MTDLLEKAVQTARTLSPERQDEIARMMLLLADDDDGVVQLTPEEEASLSESLAEADRGEFASEEEVRAIWAKFGR